MLKNIKHYLYAGIIAGFLSSGFAWAKPPIDLKSGSQSVTLQGNQGPASVHYNGTINNFYGERLGKKIVIREMYLVPYDQFNTHRCDTNVDIKHCGDFYEAVGIYLEIQSIWPEPILLTAGQLSVISPRHNFGLGPKPGGSGRLILDEMITQTGDPREFLLQPGEIKRINLSQGFRLNGVLDFFDKRLSDAEIETSKVPYAFYDLTIVDDFDRFLKKKYGAQAALKISLYEKDYKPLLVTVAKLGGGTDFFERGDPTKRNGYNFQHDRFLAEVLYQLRGGKESLFERMRQLEMEKRRVRSEDGT